MASNKKLIFGGIGLGLVIIYLNRKSIASWFAPLTGSITSPFGMRTDPITGLYSLHNGVDIAAPNGTHIKAPFAGIVENVWTDSANGNAIKIKHPNGFKTGYAHLSKQAVKIGDKIKAGDYIGDVGSTGHSTGNHLHFTISKPDANGNYTFVDPMTVIKSFSI